MLPKEQNTQQSPGLGRSIAPHPLHGYKKWQASVCIVSVSWCLQCGHVITDRTSPIVFLCVAMVES